LTGWLLASQVFYSIELCSYWYFVVMDFVSRGRVIRVFLTEHHATKAYWGSGDVAVRIL